MINLEHICFEPVRPTPACATRSFAPPRLAETPGQPGTKSDSAQGASGWLLQKAGLFPNAYRAASLDRRFPALLRRFRLTTLESLKDLIETNPELLPRAVDILLNGNTEFFRDPAVFLYLRDAVIPELLKTRRGVEVYSAGVSDGQELYSVAILLAEAGALERSDLVGVDCRASALVNAAGGFFDSRAMHSLPGALRDRYFTREHGGWRARRELRDRCRWVQHDIQTFSPGAGVFDLVLFRNVAIYLQAKCSDKVFENIYAQLSPGGFLITGKADKPPAGLPFRRAFGSVYQKG